MDCKNCGSSFKQKFPTQTLCVNCYYEEHPEKDYRKQNRDRLYSQVGHPMKKTSGSYYGKFIPMEEQIGIADNELLNDDDYIQKVTSFLSSPKSQIDTEKVTSQDTIKSIRPLAQYRLKDGKKLSIPVIVVGNWNKL